jgi:hypothetical protein
MLSLCSLYEEEATNMNQVEINDLGLRNVLVASSLGQ